MLNDVRASANGAREELQLLDGQCHDCSGLPGTGGLAKLPTGDLACAKLALDSPAPPLTEEEFVERAHANVALVFTQKELDAYH